MRARARIRELQAIAELRARLVPLVLHGLVLQLLAGPFHVLARALHRVTASQRKRAERKRSYQQQNFRDHRSEFEQIRSMLERDENIFRIDDDWTDPTDLPAEKVQEYRHLFAILGTPRGFYNRRNPFRIELIASARGWVTSGSMKGYVYLTERPKDTVSDLDRYHNGSGAKVDSALRHIEGNWYLFFDH